ncbi:LamG domain-containing protein [Niastella populi]|uniref:LamG-like jellyroll fold domain-containing protein n=1 Tax=Niastella populi TaxID=550983 RepID=A0A1V9FPM4_9BACT|nr:LamG domain-containing protein [Niastella populi]OQP60247.1 hypothetical protein A4R26_20030 [Niastella populi]
MRKLVFFFGLIINNCALAQSNYAVNNDGSNDYVSLPTSVAVSQLNTFTVEAWVYWNGTGNGCIYSETVQGNNSPMFSIIPRSTNGGGIELVLRDNSATGLVMQPATATVTANTWVHVAVVRTSASNIKTYINGVLKDNATFTAPASWTPTKVNAGVRWRASQSDFFAGKIDELRIWNTARSAAEIVANMFNKNLANNATGLVAYYRFNEGSSTTAANSCTNTSGADGTLTNGPTWAASPIQFAGNALHFDEGNDRVIAPLPTTATSNVTMEAWVYHQGGTGTDHLIMVNGVMGSNGYALFLNTSHKLIVLFNGVNTWNTGIGLSTGQWTHLALVIGTTGFTLYKNGVNVYSNTGTPNTPSANFILGFNTVANGQPFGGMIDEVRIWNTARTQTEIQNNMNSEIAPSTSGLALYYTFNQGIAAGNNTGLTALIDQSGNGNNGTLTNFALSGSTSNNLTQNSNLVILPLRWISFITTKQYNNVLLQWSTAQEHNTKDFLVQHSIDSRSWTNVATNAATGNSSSINNYSYLHTAPLQGMNYYRIVQRDVDGRFGYSVINSVKFNTNREGVQVMNNLIASGILLVKITASIATPVSLHSGNGNLLWRRQLAPGIHSIDVSRYANGIYLLKTGEQIEKIIVQ